MKNNLNQLTLALILALCMFGSDAAAQRAPILKFSVSDPLSGRYGVGLEKRIAKGLSVAVEMDCLSKEVFFESDHPWYEPLMVRKEGFVFEPQVRLYRGDVLSGAYASLSGVFGFAEYTTETGFIDNDDWSSVGAIDLWFGLPQLRGRLTEKEGRSLNFDWRRTAFRPNRQSRS